MKTTMKLGIAAALAFGVAGNALAEGYPDLSYPAGYESSAQTQRLAIQQARKIWGSALDAYGRVDQGFHRDEDLLFDRATGNTGG